MSLHLSERPVVVFPLFLLGDFGVFVPRLICIFVASDFHCYDYFLKQDLSGFSIFLQIFFDVAFLPYILV